MVCIIHSVFYIELFIISGVTNISTPNVRQAKFQCKHGKSRIRLFGSIDLYYFNVIVEKNQQRHKHAANHIIDGIYFIIKLKVRHFYAVLFAYFIFDFCIIEVYYIASAIPLNRDFSMINSISQIYICS